MNTTGTITGILAAGVIGATALAGPVRSGAVPEDATWVAHVDIEALLGSSIGQFALEQAQAEGELDDLEEFRRETGLDPLEDFFGATISGIGEDESTVVVFLEGTAALEGIFDVIDEHLDDAEHSTFRRRGLTIHKFSGDDETWLATALDLGRNRAGLAVSASIDRLVEAASGMERGGKADVLRLAKPSAGSIAFVAATEIPGHVADHGPASALLGNSDGLAIDVGESRGELFIHGILDTANAETANMAMQSVNGLKAMVSLFAAGEPEAAPYVHLLDGLTFGLNGSALTASFEIDTEELFQLIAEAEDLDEGFAWDDDEDEAEAERIEELERRIKELERELEKDKRRRH